MSEQAGDINTHMRDKKTTLDYLLELGGWLVSCISLLILGLIAYWAVKIPEKNINNLPIINAIKGDIRVEPAHPGGKSFDDENLSIYKNIENIPKIPKKSDITLNDTDQGNINILEEIKTHQLGEGDAKDLNLAIEDALKQVVYGKIKANDLLEISNQKKSLKLYLGSFDTKLQATEFKDFIKKKNKKLLEDHDLKIFQKLEGNKKIFRVQLTKINSKAEGEKLCSILSSRQFSCLLFND